MTPATPRPSGPPGRRAATGTPASPEASPRSRLAHPLAQLSRRLLAESVLNGALAGLVVGVVGLVAWVLAQPVVGQGSFPGGAGAASTCVLGAMGLGVALSLRARLAARRRHGGWMPDAARRVEAAVPASRNLVLTASEFPSVPHLVEPGVSEAILADAVTLLDRHPPRSLVPLNALAFSFAALATLAVGMLLVVSALEGGRGLPPGFPASLALGPPAAGGAGIVGGMDVEIRIVPPAYSGDSIQVHRNPDRVEALQGSRLELTVRLQGRTSPIGGVAGDGRGDGAGGRSPGAASGESVILETLEGRRELQRGGSGDHVGEITVENDGFLALERRAPISAVADGSPAPSRRLIGVGALVDPPPMVRFSAPGQDLYLPDGNRAIDLEVEATDDRAIRSLELLFTRVSGFGELFEFREGSVPLEIIRHEASRWTARARWDLAELELDRGDVVVYRAVAHDHRPGAPPGESETWTVEILGSEAAPSGGFAGEDELTRYGLSQQMVLVLTERVRDQQSSLSAERLAEEASMLAAAQRRVRAEFVFMLGGHLEDDHDHADPTGADAAVHADDADHDAGHDHGHDAVADPGAAADDGSGRTAQELHEEAHARADADAAEGRLAQAGRIELSRAIQAMSLAVTHLNAVDLEAALAAEALALEHLQRAFSSSRYLLRALSEREELDPARRLSGERSSATVDRRPQVETAPDGGHAELRGVLGEVIRIASHAGSATRPQGSGTDQQPARTVADAPGLAARLLAVDPASETLQRLSAALAADPDREQLLDVVTGLSRYLRSRHPHHPGTAPTPDLRTLESAWAEAIDRAGMGSR